MFAEMLSSSVSASMPSRSPESKNPPPSLPVVADTVTDSGEKDAEKVSKGAWSDSSSSCANSSALEKGRANWKYCRSPRVS